MCKIDLCSALNVAAMHYAVACGFKVLYVALGVPTCGCSVALLRFIQLVDAFVALLICVQIGHRLRCLGNAVTDRHCNISAA